MLSAEQNPTGELIEYLCLGIIFYYFRRKQKRGKTVGFVDITRMKEVLALSLQSLNCLFLSDIFLKAKTFVLSLMCEGKT